MREAHEAMMRDLVAYGIRDERVLDAMRRVPRHAYIPEIMRRGGEYGDHPVPIGYGQTISQPYIVAYMTEMLDIREGEKVLEIGTGSGYQAAVLAELGARVFSLEVVPDLAEHARTALEASGYDVKIRIGDGYEGWPEEAPFDAIVGTCAAEEIPLKLVGQLRENGRLFMPIGETDFQKLVLVRRTKDGMIRFDDLPVRFVPMIHPRPRH